MKAFIEGNPEINHTCLKRIELVIDKDSIIIDLDSIREFTQDVVNLYYHSLCKSKMTIKERNAALEEVMDMVSDATGYDLVEEYTTTLETQNETIEGLHDEIRDMMEG